MNTGKSSMPRNPTLRQTIEGMPFAFNRNAAADLRAVIQFNASGQEPGIYHLAIDSGNCTFHSGKALNPTLCINTPSEIWMQIATGESSGKDALLKGLYTVEGDASLLPKMGELFREREDFSVYDTSLPEISPLFQVFRKPASANKAMQAGKRPAGPVPLSGMDWMFLLFVPWTVFWILFDIKSVSPWLASGIPLILMTLIVLYRTVYNRPAWPEVASWAFFLTACLLGPVMNAAQRHSLPGVLSWVRCIWAFCGSYLWRPRSNCPYARNTPNGDSLENYGKTACSSSLI
jgi:putative sterol carrier protein